MAGAGMLCGRITGYGNPDFQIAIRYHPGEQLQTIAHDAVVTVEGGTEQAGLDRIFQGLPFLDGVDFFLVECASGNKAHPTVIADEFLNAK